LSLGVEELQAAAGLAALRRDLLLVGHFDGFTVQPDVSDIPALDLHLDAARPDAVVARVRAMQQQAAPSWLGRRRGNRLAGLSRLLGPAPLELELVVAVLVERLDEAGRLALSLDGEPAVLGDLEDLLGIRLLHEVEVEIPERRPLE